MSPLLIEQLDGLASKIAKQYSLCDSDRDDLFQEGALAVLESSSCGQWYLQAHGAMLNYIQRFLRSGSRVVVGGLREWEFPEHVPADTETLPTSTMPVDELVILRDNILRYGKLGQRRIRQLKASGELVLV